jgi:putative phosphoribosyl transferase
MPRSISREDMAFHDRREAGKRLAQKLKHFMNESDAIVLALPRGGVPVAYEVANELHLPLDVFLVRKLGTPGQEELAMGAIGSGGACYLNVTVLRSLDISVDDIRAVVDHERRELERRENLYRDGRPSPTIAGRVAILIDDGLATGASMYAAVAALRKRDPKRIVVAVPVAPADAIAELRSEVDEVVCLFTPEPFIAVGAWYADFSQTTDDEVRALLNRAASERATHKVEP